MITAAVFVAIAGLILGGTGPAWQDAKEARRARRDRPLARVIYLPSAACRSRRCPDPDHCAICAAEKAASKQ